MRDLQIAMLAAIRESLSISLDIHTENPQSSGGFIRHYEVPEIIKKACPVYLKTGGSIAAHHGYDTTRKEAGARARQVLLVQSMVNRFYPEAIISSPGAADLAIPSLK